MKGQQLFDILTPNLLKIVPSEQNLSFFKEIQKSLQSIEIIDYFYQIKKNDKGDGLAFEVMMFDIRTIFDIVITKTHIDYISVLLSNVNMAYIESTFEDIANDKGDGTVVDKLQFSISYGADIRNLVYLTDTKRFAEINRIKNNLLKTLAL